MSRRPPLALAALLALSGLSLPPPNRAPRCLSCGERAMRKDERVAPPAYKWRCRSCGKGYACYPVAVDAPFTGSRTRVAPSLVENDADWQEVAA